jgi:hypothetical protein
MMGGKSVAKSLIIQLLIAHHRSLFLSFPWQWHLALQRAAIQRLRGMSLEELSPTNILRYCTEAAKLERAILGEPQSIEEKRLTGTGGSGSADQTLRLWRLPK